MSAAVVKEEKKSNSISKEMLLKAFELMCTAKTLAEKYEENKEVTSKYVHATSRGHEAIQLAVGMQLKPQDWVSPYYRDDSILLGIGMTPYELMLQVFAKKDDPFSGGRTYYSHPSLDRDNMPKIPHQSSATGMQAIPTTGIAMGIQYKEKQGLAQDFGGEDPVVVCSLGDASCTEGEVSEAFQMAALKQFPIVYLVQDNGWDISAKASEIRSQDASEYAAGFRGLERGAGRREHGPCQRCRTNRFDRRGRRHQLEQWRGHHHGRRHCAARRCRHHLEHCGQFVHRATASQRRQRHFERGWRPD